MMIDWEDVSLVAFQTTAVFRDGTRLLIQVRSHPFLEAWGFSINGLGPVTYYNTRDDAVTAAEEYIGAQDAYIQKRMDEEA